MNEFRLEAFLASKVAWGALRVLLRMPIVYHSAAEIARALGTSHASVSRVLGKLVAAGVVTRSMKRYRVDAEQALTRYLWLLLQVERYKNLPPDLVNKLELIVNTVGLESQTAVLFGSWARGLADEQSDVDICFFGGSVRAGRLIRPPYTFEVQTFDVEELAHPSRTVVLDAVLDGIPLKDPEGVYQAAINLRAFPKSFLLARLEQAQAFIAQADELSGAARDYYRSLAGRTLQQIDSILERGRTVSRRELEAQPLEPLLHRVSGRLAREGDVIWLT